MLYAFLAGIVSKQVSTGKTFSMNLLIVDDHPLFREAVRAALAHGVPETQLRSFANLGACLSDLRATGPVELVLLDLGLPGYSGIGALEDFRLQCPSIPVVVLSGQEDRKTVLECLDAGAMGYIPKSVEQSLLIAALRLVASGGIYIPKIALQYDTENPGPSSPTNTSEPETNAHQKSMLINAGLTDRQFSVLRLIVKGLPNKLIARELNLSENTVKTHVSAVLLTVGARNRTQAVLAASRLGLRF